MTEATLLQQTLLLSGAVTALLLLRPLLKRLGGAPALYLGWLAVPLVLLSPALPRPASSPLPATYTVQLGEWTGARAAAAATRSAPEGIPWLALWAAGAIGLALLLAWRQGQFQRQIHRRRLPAGQSPAWVGLWRPRLMLPADFRQRFTPEERRLIRAHERVHALRQDNLWSLLATSLWLLHWFNPLAWWALRRFRGDQELSADAAVLRARPAQTGRYLRTLAKAQPGAMPPLVISPFAPHPLIERITMLQSASRRAARPWLALLSSLALLGSALALTPGPQPARQSAQASTTRSSPMLLLRTWFQGREVDREIAVPDAQGNASARLTALNNKDLLLTLNTSARPEGALSVAAHMSLGHPMRSVAELGGLLRSGRPLMMAINDPTDLDRKVIVEVHLLADPAKREPPAPDPDQSGEVDLDLQAYIDSQPVGRQQIRVAMSHLAPIKIRSASGALIEGQVHVSARMPNLIDLRFQLSLDDRKIEPRLLTPSGQRATLESNSQEDPRVFRIEVTPRRIKP